MSRKHYFYCDLCGTEIKIGDGIAAYHEPQGKIVDKALMDNGCGHHLCNKCVDGLRDMIAEMDRAQAVRASIR